jgi:apolipoprotein N-acyltransferase
MRKKLAYIFPSLVSGTALIFCFPYFNYSPLAFIALVPFLVSLCGRSGRGAFVSGFFMGLVFIFGTNYWVYHSISKYGGVNIVTSLLIVLLLSMYLSLYTGLFATLFVSRIKNTSLPAMFLAPVLWVVIEYIRSLVLTGLPYSLIGYTQHGFLRLIQISDITGVYGVSFIVIAVNGAIADFFILKQRVSEKPLFHKSPTLIGYFLLAMALTATLLYGSHRLGEAQGPDTVKTVIIQPNIDQNMKWDPRYQDSVLGSLEDLTRESIINGADIVIWPETALPFYYIRDKKNTRRLRSFVRSIRTPLLTGTITVNESKEKKITLGNSSILLHRNGRETFRYNKIHLVPFGEYVPLKNILGFIDKLVVGIGDYIPGKSFSTAKTNDNRFASIICYEVAFPSLVRKFFKNKADFLVIMTNDAWFGRTTGPYHHFAMSVFRAIENRKPVLRAANTGISGVIDSYGRVRQRTSIFTKTTVVDSVSTDNRTSIYSRFGDLFIYLCSIITIILMADLRRK